MGKIYKLIHMESPNGAFELEKGDIPIASRMKEIGVSDHNIMLMWQLDVMRLIK